MTPSLCLDAVHQEQENVSIMEPDTMSAYVTAITGDSNVRKVMSSYNDMIVKHAV